MLFSDYIVQDPNPYLPNCPCQPLLQQCIALLDHHIPDSTRQRLLRSDNNHQLPGTGHTGIDQVPLEHDSMVAHNRHDDNSFLNTVTLCN